MHGMHQRQTLGGLHDTEDELAGDAAGLFVHAIGANILFSLAFAVDAHSGQVIEDHRQLLIDQGADLFGRFCQRNFA